MKNSKTLILGKSFNFIPNSRQTLFIIKYINLFVKVNENNFMK